MVYVEGDAQMRQYDDAEGKKQSALSVVQREFDCSPLPNAYETGWLRLPCDSAEPTALQAISRS